MLSANLKGAIAETKIVAEATELGLTALTPAVEHSRYDMAFDIGGRLHRVQCKWAAYDAQRGVVKIKLQSQRHTPNGYVRTTYSEDEIDLVAAYCGELRRSYLLPRHLAVRRREIWLRTKAPANAQRACINLASDFEFPGAVAQLEERVAGSDEVRGSSPLSSTPTVATDVTRIGSHEFRNHFGLHLEQAAAGKRILVTRHGRAFAELGPPSGDEGSLSATVPS